MSESLHVMSPLSDENLELFEDFAAEVAANDGAHAFSEQTLVEVRKAAGKAGGPRADYDSPRKDPLPATVWISAGAQPAAVAVLLPARSDQPGLVEGAVLPRYRGRGLGSRLVGALEDFAVQRAPGTYHLWQHQILGGGGQQQRLAMAALTERAGFAPVRELHKLTLPLTVRSRADIARSAAETPLPAGIEVSTFIPGTDDSAWLGLNAAAFSSHPEQGSLTQEDLDQRIAADWFDPRGFFLAREGGKLAGFHWTKIPAGQSDEGEVYAVGIAPEQQGRGLGRALTLTGMDYLAQTTVRGQKLRRIVLYVDAENTAALRLYRSLGFEPETIDIMYTGTLEPTP